MKTSTVRLCLIPPTVHFKDYVLYMYFCMLQTHSKMSVYLMSNGVGLTLSHALLPSNFNGSESTLPT